MISLFNQFIKERRYVKNSAENTIYYYEQCFKTYQKFLGEKLPTKQYLTEFVTNMREGGIKPSTCNCYIRGFNSFLGWLFENQYIPEPLKIKLLKCEQRVMKTFTDEQLRAIINFKPTNFYERRLHTLLLTLADTGIRIDEALTLTKDKIDFDNLLITVRGKGSKERVIPISYELRKILYKYVQQHKFNLVFSTNHGDKLLYDNMRRSFNTLMTKLEIDVEGAFHAFRRSFAKNYVRNGGNLFYLQKALGHTTLTMSRRYVELETEDLSEMHTKTSLLSRIR